jgi:hypothetical protein
MLLTKSKFIAGEQCLKRLYLLVHEPELKAQPDESDESIIKQGRQVHPAGAARISCANSPSWRQTHASKNRGAIGYTVRNKRMSEIFDISPPIRYSLQRQAAQSSLSRSRFFLLLGFAPSFYPVDNLEPSSFCTSSALDLKLSPVTLCQNESQQWRSGDSRILLEFTRRMRPGALAVAANKVASALTGLFTHVHHTAYCEFTLYQIPREMIEEGKIETRLLEELDALTGESPFPEHVPRTSRIVCNDLAAIDGNNPLFTSLRSAKRTLIRRLQFFPVMLLRI